MDNLNHYYLNNPFDYISKINNTSFDICIFSLKKLYNLCYYRFNYTIDPNIYPKPNRKTIGNFIYIRSSIMII